ncbi:hypothetical protein J2Z19_005473 [Ensifer adhaerens]|uniref:Uncharacterized protein n=1 Tax=Ensifer adhaerens TaxID=106592 RepID=A0ACC5T3M0_ENSAD|nr:hypothetical protein [Ensifer adhaerens]MBP1875736.1 hypothetical protein [Ensifer adhaerens]
MKKLLSALAAISLAASFALPLSAAPIFVPKPVEVQAITTAEQVNHWRNRHWRADRRWDRRWDRRHAWRSCGYYGRCYPRYYGYNGYRDGYGYRDRYRYHRRSGVTIYFNF